MAEPKRHLDQLDSLEGPDLWQRVVEFQPSDRPLEPPARSVRRRVMAGSVALVVFALAAGLLWQALGRPSPEVSGASAVVPSPPRLITYRDEARGLTVSYPISWFRATQQLTPHLSNPHEILALGTYPLRPGGRKCAQLPVQAIGDLGPGDALLWLAERAGPASAPPRPASFRSALLSQGTDESPACLSSPKDFSHRVIAFSDAGRVFELYVAYGPSIPESRFEQLLAILDGLRFDRST